MLLEIKEHLGKYYKDPFETCSWSKPFKILELCFVLLLFFNAETENINIKQLVVILLNTQNMQFYGQLQNSGVNTVEHCTPYETWKDRQQQFRF